MADLSLVGRCGLFCGTCGIYRAYKDNGAYLEKVARSFDCAPELVRCEGCQALTPDCWGNGCKIVICLRKKGLEFCYECGELDGCGKFSELSDGYMELGINLRGNMERIRTGDTERWLDEEDMRWRCGSCGEPISCHMEECNQCGAGLVKVKD